MKIISFSGKIGVGKDYAANITVEELKKKGYNPIILSFAASLKVHVASKHGIEMDRLNNRKDTEARSYLQTEGKRMNVKYGNDVFIKSLESWWKYLSHANGYDVLVIPDARFISELNWVKSHEHGNVIRIESKSRNEEKLDAECKNQADKDRIRNDVSETQLDDMTDSFDAIIGNEKGQGNVFHFNLCAFIDVLYSLDQL